MAEQTHDQRGLVGILAAVVAALLLVPRPGGGTTSTPATAAVGGVSSSMIGAPPGTPDAPSSAPESRAPAEERMDALVRHYLGAKDSRDSLACLLECDNATITTLLMCVADPVSSSHGYRTDLQIETLQRALADTQHVADRWWLPWAPPAGGPTARDGTPGLMLFRKKCPDGHTQLLAVYLVGELMTSGIDRDSLRKALNDAREVLKQSGSDQSVIPILGPIFSGSTDSLGLTLRDQPNEDPDVVVVNFSATAFDFQRFSALHGQGPAVAYAATIARFDEQRKALLEYVSQVKGRRPEVAWLTEVGTGLSTGAGKGTEQTDQSTFSFPTGIAQVRDAYAKAAASGPRPALVSPGDRTLLPFPVDAQTGARDLVPRFSAGMQGAYTELSLRHLLLDVARGDFDAVGIIATDHRDRAFLAERVRQHVPGALILLVGGDLAYDHPLHRQAMLGALVASAYPPFLAHHVWPPDPVLMERRAAAPTQANAALLNAVALGTAMARCPPEPNDRGLITSYAPPNIRLWHYDDPFRPAGPECPPMRPPIWISTIGYQGAWPLQAVTCPGTSCVVEIAPTSREPLAVNPTGTSCVVGSATESRETQPAGRNLPGVHRNLLPLTQVVALQLVIAVLVTVALRGGCASGDAGGRDWSASDEFVRPLAEWWNGRRVAAGSAWRLSGPLVLVLAGLWLPAAAMATVAVRGLIAHAEPDWDGHVATLGASWPIAWFVLGTGLLAPWPVPRWLRLILVVAAVAVALRCVGSPWLVLVAILAATATLHLLSSLVRMPWQAWTRQDVSSPAEYWLTGSAWFMTIGLLVALAGSIRNGSTHIPWLLTSAAIFNGISPLLPLTTAGLALAAVWYAELVRAWRADEYPVPSTLGVESAADAGVREQEQEAIRYPLLGRRADKWLIDHLQGVGGRTPLGMLHFVLLLAGGLWLVDLARRLEPIYPEPAAHWTCVMLLITAYLSWALVLVRTQTLIDTLFIRLNRFRREVERPGSQLRAAFPSLHRPADVGLGRLLFYRPPPSATLDDLTDTLSQAQRRVIGMKRFVRSLGGQIRWLGAGLAAGAILLFVAATSLPCQPRSDLLLTSTLSFVAFAWVSVRMLLRIERDSVLGLIAGSTPGQVSWDFQTVTKLALPVAVPVLLVLGQAFPDAWHWLTAIVEGWRGS